MIIYRKRPRTIPENTAIQIEQRLSLGLAQRIPRYSFDIAVTEEIHGRASVTVHTEISIEGYERTKRLVIRGILSEIIPIFELQDTLHCLVIRVDVYDDKVAVSDEYVLREDILQWKDRSTSDNGSFPQVRSYAEQIQGNIKKAFCS